MELKKYEELTKITLKDGTVLVNNQPLEILAKSLNSKDCDFIKVDGVVFNRYEVAKAETFHPDDMECFIFGQSDLTVQIALREILDKRKANGYKTNGPKHLRHIYLSKQTTDGN